MLRWRGLCWITCIFLVSCGIPEQAGSALATPAKIGRPSPTPTPAAPAIPLDVLSGDLRWTPAQSPVILQHDQRLLPGATLIIEPDTEVQLAPGVAFFVEGTLSALGQPGHPVRFVGTAAQRWDGLFGRTGSSIA